MKNSEALDPIFVFNMLRRVICLELAALAVSGVKCSEMHAFHRNMPLYLAEAECESGD